jgi:hypothetical protein
MKKKVKKFADGNVVRTRTDDEIAEDNKNPYGRYTPKTKSYSLDDVKSGIGRLFGGKSDSTEKSTSSEDRPKSDGVQDYASLGKRFGSMPAKSTWDGSPNIKEEQKETPKEEPTRKISDYINKDVTTTDEKAVEREVMDVKPEKKAAPNKNLKNAIGEDADPLPGNPKAKEKAKNLPGKPEPKSKITPYSAPKKISKDEKAAIKKRAEQDDEDQEKLRKQFEKNKADNETAKKSGKSLTPYAKGNAFAGSTEGWAKMLRDSNKKEEKKMAKGGSVSSASSRGDGIAMRGKTRGRIC